MRNKLPPNRLLERRRKQEEQEKLQLQRQEEQRQQQQAEAVKEDLSTNSVGNRQQLNKMRNNPKQEQEQKLLQDQLQALQQFEQPPQPNQEIDVRKTEQEQLHALNGQSNNEGEQDRKSQVSPVKHEKEDTASKAPNLKDVQLSFREHAQMEKQKEEEARSQRLELRQKMILQIKKQKEEEEAKSELERKLLLEESENIKKSENLNEQTSEVAKSPETEDIIHDNSKLEKVIHLQASVL